jgi:hypothetical protein
MLRPRCLPGAICRRATPPEMVPCDLSIIISQLKMCGAPAVFAWRGGETGLKLGLMNTLPIVYISLS